MKPDTTAYFREMARLSEEACDWPAAADYLQKALDAYPSQGALAERDKRHLAARLEACRQVIDNGGN